MYLPVMVLPATNWQRPIKIIWSDVLMDPVLQRWHYLYSLLIALLCMTGM